MSRASLFFLGLPILLLCVLSAPLEPVAVKKAVLGMTLDARNAPGNRELDRLAALGVSHIAVIPYAFMPSPEAPELRYSTTGRWFSESGQGIRSLSVDLAARDLKLIVKPQIWLRGGLFPGDIVMPDDEAWQIWEAQYRAYVMAYARLAQDAGASIFVIGTELAISSRERAEFWRQLAAEVRGAFTGHITYAANWYDEMEHVEFWDELDRIGVQAYFPLSDSAEPTVEELIRGWSPYRSSMQRLSKNWDRPILITELGYRSAPGAAHEPWSWVQRDDFGVELPDPDLQARLFGAFFAAPWTDAWIEGVVIWKWSPEGRRTASLDFTPRDKPAEATISRAFAAQHGAMHNSPGQ